MNVAGLTSKCISWDKNRDKSQECFSKSYYCLRYKRPSKETRKGNPPTPTSSFYIQFRLSHSNHSLCSDVPSESSSMILHTISQRHIGILTPQHPTSQHFFLHPHLIHIILHYFHTITRFLRSSRTFVPALL
jgi:hypothetical protein